MRRKIFDVLADDFLSTHEIPFLLQLACERRHRCRYFFRQLDAPTPQRQNIENQIFYDTVQKMGVNLVSSDDDDHSNCCKTVSNKYPCSGF